MVDPKRCTSLNLSIKFKKIRYREAHSFDQGMRILSVTPLVFFYDYNFKKIWDSQQSSQDGLGSPSQFHYVNNNLYFYHMPTKRAAEGIKNYTQDICNLTFLVLNII